MSIVTILIEASVKLISAVKSNLTVRIKKKTKEITKSKMDGEWL